MRYLPVGTYLHVPGVLGKYNQGYYTGRRRISHYDGSMIHFALLDGQPSVAGYILHENLVPLLDAGIFRLSVDSRIALPHGI